MQRQEGIELGARQVSEDCGGLLIAASKLRGSNSSLVQSPNCKGESVQHGASTSVLDPCVCNCILDS
ncbi:hypothetical protein PAHAL_9G474400 [Panicum hallii]|jgi:hypothetical protein|uniref:Uncharacterized protein n=1 Tax=Panicum hallii TaxID=206008 RepID=A0A2T8I4Y6_9POAL|nr:hypothetical protein PAHAL_9G474400 [Panicum hallii]